MQKVSTCSVRGTECCTNLIWGREFVRGRIKEEDQRLGRMTDISEQSLRRSGETGMEKQREMVVVLGHEEVTSGVTGPKYSCL